MTSVTAVVGGQYGSEGKGAVVASIAGRFDAFVRSGGPNAGHTIYFIGRRWKMQQLPCGWVNPRAALVIAPGAVFSPRVLLREVAAIADALGWFDDLIERVFIDDRAGVLDDHHHEQEGGTGGELHRRIGSTGEGVGAARMARLARDPALFRQARDIRRGEFVAETARGRVDLVDMVRADTPGLLLQYLRSGRRVLLEGTQGFGLSLVHGLWPYVTTADTTAAQLCADAGLPPLAVRDVLVVLRTYPIRVAGNSGPLKGEMTWEELSSRIGTKVEERTTVTNKVRRVGEWDGDLAARACRVNGATQVALTFADYIDPAITGATRREQVLSSARVRRFINRVEEECGTPVRYVGTGGHELSVVDLWEV